MDPDLFFPPVEVGPLCVDQIERAKRVCAACPVRAECLRWALNGLADGIAGGLTAEERRLYRGHRSGADRVYVQIATRDGGRLLTRVGPDGAVLSFGRSGPAREARPEVAESAAATAPPAETSHNSNGLAATRAAEGHRA
ncbi:hypothetical protein BJF78_17330 [Pseudonocardia sp. CNS-139]|nr:hypothetical protein BJF78_17330 [Pseudonocardia sp. CNS-139]